MARPIRSTSHIPLRVFICSLVLLDCEVPLPNVLAQAGRTEELGQTERRNPALPAGNGSAISFPEQLFCRLARSNKSRTGIYPINFKPLNLHNEMLRTLPPQANFNLADASSRRLNNLKFNL